MRGEFPVWLGLTCAGLGLLAAGPARADITVIGRYTFVNGDTATRASYFTPRRIRISTPDGREVIFDSKANRVTLVDHRRRVYWNGGLGRADSIVDVTDGTRWELVLRNATGEVKAEIASAMAVPTDSIRMGDGFTIREIAGHPCIRWTVRAGPSMSLERWTADSLAVEPYDETREDAVLDAFLDPVARAVMSMYWDLQESQGLCLAATLTLNSPGRQASFHWEAARVVGARIPGSAWRVPRDYRPARLARETPPTKP